MGNSSTVQALIIVVYCGRGDKAGLPPVTLAIPRPGGWSTCPCAYQVEAVTEA